MTKRICAIFAAVFAGLLVYGFGWTNQDVDDSNRSPINNQRIEETDIVSKSIQNNFAGIRQNMMRLQAKVNQLEETQNESQINDDVPRSDERDAADNSSTMAPKVVDNALAEQHQKQKRDSQWSPVVEAQLENIFDEGIFPGSTLADADCRSTFCRAVITNENEKAQSDFQETMAQTAPFDTEGFVRNIGTDESPELVVYFAREGESLQNLLTEM